MALSIDQGQYNALKQYADAKDYVGGWQYLATIGDRYADNAAIVSSGRTDASNPYHLSQQLMVRKHCGSKGVSFAFIFISEQSCRAADVSNSPKSRCASFCAA